MQLAEKIKYHVVRRTPYFEAGVGPGIVPSGYFQAGALVESQPNHPPIAGLIYVSNVEGRGYIDMSDLIKA